MRKGLVAICTVVSIGLAGWVGACSSSSRTSGFDENNPAPAGSNGQTGGPDQTPGLGTGSDKAVVDVTLKGKVYAPNGTLPLGGALVYVTDAMPAEITQAAYCDKCVELPEGSFTYSKPDGSFELPRKVAPGKSVLVVQKGQFRRARTIEVAKAGDIAVPKDMTTLPGKRDAANNDETPKMAILKDSSYFDKIDTSLTKLGITGVDIKSDRSILDNETELLKYHVVFVPCGAKDDVKSQATTSRQNLVKFVQAGGRLYVTDWSYEFVRQPFGGFLSWSNETAQLGSAASIGEWDAPAQAEDTGLKEWLTATGDSSFQVVGNWTQISSVNTLPTLDHDGNTVNVTPKVWVTATKNGKQTPTTVSFENKCGRVLFSTYHTEGEMGTGGTSSLSAQEKALLYVLLEIGVCVGTPPGGTK